MLNKLLCLFILSLTVINLRATAAENNWICIENANGEWVCGDGTEPVVEVKQKSVEQAPAQQAPTFLRARGNRQLPFMPLGSSPSQQSTAHSANTQPARQAVKTQPMAPIVTNESNKTEDEPVVQINPIQISDAEPLSQQETIEQPPAAKQVNHQETQAKQETQQTESVSGVNPGSSSSMARKYFVQLISVREPEGLDAIKSKLRDQGIQWVTGSVNVKGATWWVLGIGPFAHYKQSKQALNRWQQDYPGAWIRKISQIQE